MPRSITALLKDAAARLEQHDFGTALQRYREALEIAPANAGAAMGLAMILNRTGQPAQALRLLEQLWSAVGAAGAKADAKQQAAVLAQLGLAHEQLSRLGDALEFYRQAGRLVHSPDLDRRIAQLAPLVSSPVAVQQLILNARRMQETGQLQEAGRTLQAALQLHPDNGEALHELALVLRRLGASGDALPLLQKATILCPERADYYNDLGMLFQDRGDFAKAASFHKRALKLDPRFAAACINLGVACKRLGKLQESEQAYEAALKLDPACAEAHNNLGNLLRLRGDLAGAKKHLQRALKLRADYPDAVRNLAAVRDALAAAQAVASTIGRARAPRAAAPQRARPARERARAGAAR